MTLRRWSTSPHPDCMTPLEPTRRGGAGVTSPHWCLGSESESWLLVVGSYCFAGCLTRVRTGTSACNLPPHLPVETQHPPVFSKRGEKACVRADLVRTLTVYHTERGNATLACSFQGVSKVHAGRATLAIKIAAKGAAAPRSPPSRTGFGHHLPLLGDFYIALATFVAG